MVSKQKQARSVVKPHGKRAPSEPRTADEFLAAGVDFEEAGEKWRAGDAAKSCRFFDRAREAYHAGLRLFPNSFDLAYNRARLQYELAEQPRLVQYLPQPRLALLETALEYSRNCLGLDPDDADALFNTGQVLTSTADLLLEEIDENHPKAVELLREAIELFEKCFNVQQVAYSKQQEDIAALSTSQVAPDELISDVQPSDPVSQSLSSTGEEWAALVEPITPRTILDTCVAQMQAMTSMAPIVALGEGAISEMQSTYEALSQRASSSAMAASESHYLDLLLADASLSVALRAAAFRLGLISAQEYSSHIDARYSATGLEESASALFEVAQTRMAFYDDTIMNNPRQDHVKQQPFAPLQWQQLSKALEALAAAAKLPSDIARWDILEQRARAELLRGMMGLPSVSYPQAMKNRARLLENAEVYYRGAKNQAHAAGNSGVERQMGEKEAVVQMIRGDHPEDQSLKHVYEEMKEEGLLP